LENNEDEDSDGNETKDKDGHDDNAQVLGDRYGQHRRLTQGVGFALSFFILD
jgi:hypothetical protein